MMYWRGENFYTCNQIYDHRIDPSEKTVFLGDRNTEKLQEYLRNHPGRRMFFRSSGIGWNRCAACFPKQRGPRSKSSTTATTRLSGARPAPNGSTRTDQQKQRHFP